MEAWIHFTSSSILAALLYPHFGWMALLVMIGGFLIDIDHYFWYVYKTKNFSIKGCYDFYMVPFSKNDYIKHNGAFLVFHTIETLIVFLMVSFFSKILFIIFLGLLLHFALDIIYRLIKVKNLFCTPLSIIGYILQVRKSSDK